MDSCFPPLAALSLRDNRKSSSNYQNVIKNTSHRGSVGGDDDGDVDNGKIEILQDLDLYYIRQIAHTLKEYDLEQKIDLEIKMREGTTKLLAACKHQAQSLEAAKNLLTSNERMSSYMLELQRRKKEIPRPNSLHSQPSNARVCLSDLRMPLIWRDTDHFKNKGDYRRFAVFCLARIGTEIYDSSLLCPVDRSLTDLTFSDVLLFNNVPTDFELKLEVFSHMLQDDLSIASTPRKIKKTIHSSISRTVGRKLAASIKDELHTGKIGPRFELMATATLTLDDVHDSIRTHDLEIQSTETRSHQLPLFGHFCCRLAAQPNNITQESCSGEVNVQICEDVKLKNGWVLVKGFKIQVWERKEHFEDRLEPLKTLSVDKDTTLKESKNKEMTIVCNNSDESWLLKLKTTDDYQRFYKSLQQQLNDYKCWKNASENIMEMKSPGSVRNSFTRTFRQGSLYDQTPLIETVSVDKYTNQRPTVHDVFGLTPSTSLSSCASSSSSSTYRGRSNSATRHSAWTFSKKDV